MSPVDIGILSIVMIVILVYTGLYITVSLGLVSFVGVWLMRGEIEYPIALLALATADTVSHYVFATVPLFALMGLLVSVAGLGGDVYQVANFLFHRIRGGLGIATVAANAIFASITGSSIASASVFTRVSVPEMRKFNYTARFSVGVVAGSSVLGMLIPPSAMLIIYAIVTDQSVGDLAKRDYRRLVRFLFHQRVFSARGHLPSALAGHHDQFKAVCNVFQTIFYCYACHLINPVSCCVNQSTEPTSPLWGHQFS